MKHVTRTVILVALLCCCAQLHAELALPHILSDNMVLQRDKPMRIWGKGDEGTAVKVIFKEQSKSTVVKRGEWSITLDPYGQKVEHASPLYRSAKIEGPQIVIQFDHVGNGMTSNDGQPLREFTICGADHKFVPTRAKIVGNTVVVSSANVRGPVAVRYAWQNDPIVNRFGKNGLPVGPFRTDNFDLKPKH